MDKGTDLEARGFCWLHPGLLGGISKPDEAALAGLSQLGVRVLVSLTAEWQPDVALFERYGLASLYTPILDFQPPSFAQAAEICGKVSSYTVRGEAVVFHCHAGKGRTGTLLAAMLIWAGQSADAAIAETRGRNAAWIETEGQLDFLQGFAAR
ncbi:MAG: tyrosine-protein phosphatase [Rhodobacteraceae bacterium]|nr:tyrosine-protein phosphatase [Paracoccaceae bacterium]